MSAPPRVLGENAPLLVSVVEKRSTVVRRAAEHGHHHHRHHHHHHHRSGKSSPARSRRWSSLWQKRRRRRRRIKTVVLGAMPYDKNPRTGSKHGSDDGNEFHRDVTRRHDHIAAHRMFPHDKLPRTIEDRSEWGNEVGAKIIF